MAYYTGRYTEVYVVNVIHIDHSNVWLVVGPKGQSSEFLGPYQLYSLGPGPEPSSCNAWSKLDT